MAITLRHYVDHQILAAIGGLLDPERVVTPWDPLYPEQVGVATPRWHKSRGEG
jgi:hypothetical protein